MTYAVCSRYKIIYMYIKIHVYMYTYSTLAELVVEEEKKENPDPIHHILCL